MVCIGDGCCCVGDWDVTVLFLDSIDFLVFENCGENFFQSYFCFISLSPTINCTIQV